MTPPTKKPLPPYPENIAIVTSGAGAAVHDMIRILRRRYPIAKVILLPVRVQGPRPRRRSPGPSGTPTGGRSADVIITGRGGGSMEDLWAFNDERVARAIYDCETPIISAVGHEPDVTIADFVADARASTPPTRRRSPCRTRWSCCGGSGAQGSGWQKRDSGRLEAARQRLTDLAAKRVMTDRMAYVQDKRLDLDHLQQRLGGRDRRGAGAAPAEIRGPGGVAGRHEPLKVLGRGYAVARMNKGRSLESWRETAPGSRCPSRWERAASPPWWTSPIRRRNSHEREETDV